MRGLLDVTRDFFGGGRGRITVVEGVVEFLGADAFGIGIFAARERSLSKPELNIAHV